MPALLTVIAVRSGRREAIRDLFAGPVAQPSFYPQLFLVDPHEVMHAVEPEIDIRHLARIHGGSETLLGVTTIDPARLQAVLVLPGACGCSPGTFVVHIRKNDERTLSVDDQPHRIISRTGGDGVATYLIEGSSKGLRLRERRLGLARASTLLQQLAAELRALAAGSQAPAQPRHYACSLTGSATNANARSNPDPRRSNPPRKKGRPIGVQRRAWRLHRPLPRADNPLESAGAFFVL
jgi:hypothetical protein